MGEWKIAGNLSGVAGDEGEKSRCLLSRGGGVSHRETWWRWGRLVGDGLGVKRAALTSYMGVRKSINFVLTNNR